MHRIFCKILASLAIATSVTSLPSPAISESAISGGTRLRPISIRQFEVASGLRRRQDAVDFSDLSLQTQSQLIYGSPGDNGKLLLANMTLFAPDGLEMVLMERFEGLTSTVDCQGDDGEMSLTFLSEVAYNAALQEWAHINDSDDRKFLLIANHDGCGPDDERQPYLITKVTEDQSTFTTHLTAQTAPWSEIASTYDLDFGQVTPYQQTSRLMNRSLFGDIGGDIGKVSSCAGGSCDESKSVTFDVSAGTKGQVSNIYNDSKFNLDCINCFTTGSFQLAGHISTNEFSLTALTLTATPQDFLAELELEATVTASDSPGTLQYEKQLLSFPIPGAGISVTGIFSLGATLSYNVGFTSTIQGTATVDFGLSASIPNTAALTADIKNPDSSSATGFSGGSLIPLFDVKDLSASITLGAYSKPQLSFGVKLVEIGTTDVDISVKLPEVDVTLTAAYNQAGVCNGSPITTGVSVNSSYDIEVNLDIEAKFGDSASPSWSKTLFAFTEPIASQCFPLQIPGLSPSQTAVPTTASTVSILSVTATPTHVYSASSGVLKPIVNGTSYIIAPSGASVPYSATAHSGTPSFTGTNSAPSGIFFSGSGGLLSSKSSGAPYTYSNATSSGAIGATGTGFAHSSSALSGVASASSGFLLSSSGFATGTGVAPSQTRGAPYPIFNSTGSGFASASSGYLRPSGTFRS